MQVKTAMMDSANASIAGLKASIAGSGDELTACQKKLSQAEAELRHRDRDEADRTNKLQ